MTDPQELTSRFLYDELDDAQQRELNTWLAADPANADRFMRETFVHRHFMERRLIDRQVVSLAEHLPVAPTAAEAEEVQTADTPAPIFKIGIRLAGIAAAAVLLIMTTLPLLTAGPGSSNSGAPSFNSHGSIDQLLEAEWARITQRPDLVAINLTALRGDVTGDQVIDIFDYYVLESNVGLTVDAELTDGDINGNGDVGVRDFARLQVEFGAKH